MTSNERALQAVRMKREGLRLAEIGAVLGVSQGRAGQLARRGENILKDSTAWYAGLPRKVASALHVAGYENKESVYNDVLNGVIRIEPHTRPGAGHTTIARLGKQGFPDLCKWLGLSVDEVPDLLPLEIQAAKKFSSGNTLNEVLLMFISDGVNNPLAKKVLKFVANIEESDRKRLCDEVFSVYR